MDNEDTNLFGMKEVFPDAEALFSHSLQPVEDIKGDCLVVLDTNVLLLPYNTGKASLDQISKIYKLLIEQKRLIVPGQVAREFAKNRGKKISELFQQISRKRNSTTLLKNDAYPLLESLNEYKTASRLEEEINEKLVSYKKSVAQLLEQINSWQWNDPVSKLYKELFSKNVVLDLELRSNEIKRDLFRRIEQKLPPGYKDSDKPDSGIGDLIIWYTILDIAEKQKKSVIFVSGEEKADWQIRSEGQALYPRYELIDEFRQKSDGATFQILSFSNFLDLFGVSESIVAEIREKEMQQTETRDLPSENNMVPISIDALYRWLLGNYPDKEISIAKEPFDFDVTSKDNTKIGVGVKFFSTAISDSLLSNVMRNAIASTKANEYKNVIIAIIANNESIIKQVLRIIERIKPNTPNNVAFLVGHLTSNKKFRVIHFE